MTTAMNSSSNKSSTSSAASEEGGSSHASMGSTAGHQDKKEWEMGARQQEEALILDPPSPVNVTDDEDSYTSSFANAHLEDSQAKKPSSSVPAVVCEHEAGGATTDTHDNHQVQMTQSASSDQDKDTECKKQQSNLLEDDKRRIEAELEWFNSPVRRGRPSRPGQKLPRRASSMEDDKRIIAREMEALQNIGHDRQQQQDSDALDDDKRKIAGEISRLQGVLRRSNHSDHQGMAINMRSQHHASMDGDKRIIAGEMARLQNISHHERDVLADEKRVVASEMARLQGVLSRNNHSDHLGINNQSQRDDSLDVDKRIIAGEMDRLQNISQHGRDELADDKRRIAGEMARLQGALRRSSHDPKSAEASQTFDQQSDPMDNEKRLIAGEMTRLQAVLSRMQQSQGSHASAVSQSSEDSERWFSACSTTASSLTAGVPNPPRCDDTESSTPSWTQSHQAAKAHDDGQVREPLDPLVRRLALEEVEKERSKMDHLNNSLHLSIRESRPTGAFHVRGSGIYSQSETSSSDIEHDPTTIPDQESIESDNAPLQDNEELEDCQGLAKATPVLVDESLQEAQPFDPATTQKVNKAPMESQRLMAVLASACTIVLLGLILVLLILLPRDEEESSRDPSHSAEVDDTEILRPSKNQSEPFSSTVNPSNELYLLLQDFSNAAMAAIETPYSPQNTAYNWLIQDPYLHNYSNDRVLQRFALATWYYSTNGPSWVSSKNWLNYSTECDWDHVECASGEADVIKLEFVAGMSGLAGTIPVEVGMLRTLVAINLYGHNLHGTVPSELALLSNLQLLDLTVEPFTPLSDPTLSGTLPTELGLLTNLQGLSFAFNYHLGGSIPTEYGALSNLLGFYILDTSASGSMPSEFGLWSNLVWLRMEHSQFSGTVPSELGLLTSLMYLNLDHNGNGGVGFSGTIPTSLGCLTKLKRLGLCCNSFHGTLPEEIWQLTSLYALSIYKNSMTGTVGSEIGRLSSLAYLGWGENNFTSSIPSEVGMLASLNQFWAQENHHTGRIPSELVSLEYLTVLNLHGNSFNGSVPEGLLNSDNGRRFILLDGNKAHGTCSSLLDPELPCHAYFGEVNCECNMAIPEDAYSLWIDPV